MKNPWRDCIDDPPMQYKRVEIKNIKGKRYCGYRYKKQYYESFGNFIIPDPFKWRFIKDEGFMAEWIRNKLYELRLKEGVAYNAYNILSDFLHRRIR